MKKTLIACMAFLFAFNVTTSMSLAQDGGNGLQLSPTRTEVSANPGESKTFSIVLKNITKAEFTAKAILNDFESDNVSGTPKIIVDPNRKSPFTIASMVKGLSDVNLKAGETKEVKLVLDVPANASPGAYYGAVRYSVVPKSSDSNNQERQIALNASVAHLVFVEVPGEVNQQIQINSVKFMKGEKARSISVNKADKLAVSVSNLGNGFARPIGTVLIQNPFGKQVHQYELNQKEPRGIVLPKSSRTFTDEAKGISIPGRYTAIASVSYGSGGEIVSYKTTFWYTPVWFLILMLVLLLAIAGLAYWIYKKNGRHSLRRPAKPKKLR